LNELDCEAVFLHSGDASIVKSRRIVECG
jgi:hypothetical protein